MPIVFRHDAAAVVPPSNAATRKYGQQLVFQEREQKYRSTEAARDRSFDAARQINQNQFQLARDQQQASAQAIREGQQNAERTIREVQQQALREQQQREQQREIDLRNAKDGIDAYAKQVLNDPTLPAPLREKLQNLVYGKLLALQPNQYTPAAQEEYLRNYSAQIAGLLSEIPPPQPKAPPQPNFYTDQDGSKWVETSPDKWTQVPKTETERPQTFEDYYGDPQNAGKFLKDLNAKMKEMQSEQDSIADPTPVTRDSALAEMQKDYEFEQKALGRPQFGQPTLAPAMPGERIAPAMPGEQKSIVEPAEEGDAFLNWAAKQPNTLMSQLGAQAKQTTALPPDLGEPPAPISNAWAEVVAAPSQAAPELTATQVSPPIQLDFAALASNAKSDADRSFYAQMETVYKGQPSDVQSAIGVLLNPNAANVDAARAYNYLQGKGIDLNKLAEEASKTTKDKTRDKMRKQYGESYDSF